MTNPTLPADDFEARLLDRAFARILHRQLLARRAAGLAVSEGGERTHHVLQRRFEELIGFCNNAFYHGQLLTIPDRRTKRKAPCRKFA